MYVVSRPQPATGPIRRRYRLCGFRCVPDFLYEAGREADGAMNAAWQHPGSSQRRAAKGNDELNAFLLFP